MSRYTGGGGYLPLTWWLAGSAIDLWFAMGKYFDTNVGDGVPVTNYLSISRASTAWSFNSGGVLQSFANDTLRITDLGLLIELNKTNVVLWNRDLTNAAWTKTNVTATLNQTGVDGTANSATSLTSSAANGTCLQSITLASGSRFQSAYVKRLSGSGTINMTMDNGVTWTAITPTTNWSQMTIPSQTLANPTVGFRIVTSGDSIAVDVVQNEEGTFVTSPILTTTASVARAFDTVTATTSSALETILLGSTMSCVMDRKGLTGIGLTKMIHDGVVNACFFRLDPDASGVTTEDGSGNNITATVPTGVFTAGAKAGLAFTAGARSLVGNGQTVVSDAHPPLAFTSPVYMTATFNGPTSTFVRRLTMFTTKLSDGTLQGYTI